LAGSGNKIYNNKIFNTLCAIEIRDVQNLQIYNNLFTNISSFAIAYRNNVLNLEIFDNLFLDTHGVRTQDLPGSNRSVYVYRNKFFSHDNVGMNVFWHWTSEDPSGEYPLIYFYHNSFAGGYQDIMFPRPTTYDRGGLPNVHMINNIFSSRMSLTYVSGFTEDESMMGSFDYNWVGGTFTVVPAWFGPNNVNARNRRIWSALSLPNFRLPSNSDAIDAGIDLSRPFVVNGRVHSPLPGMSPGYYRGSAPDMGAIES
jgi:hypothetical protein